MKNILFGILMMLLVVLMAACSAKKNVSESGRPSLQKRAMNVSEVASLAQRYSNWETFHAPFSMRSTEPLPMSVSGRATMVRDRYIYLSLRMVGFEVACVYVDTDSCFFVDKYHKMLVTESLRSVTARTGLTVGDIQDLLMGRAFYPGSGTLCMCETPEILFSPQPQDDGTILLLPRRIPAGVSWFFTIDGAPTLLRITVDPDEYPALTAIYEETVETDAGDVAADVTLTGQIGNRNLNASLEWNLGKAKWNEDVNDPNLNFKGYKRLTVGEMVEQLKRM